jgi:hypothetical protein
VLCLPPAAPQIKATVLLMPSGSDRITSAPLQPLQSDKSVADEEVKALLATRWGPTAVNAAAQAHFAHHKHCGVCCGPS